MFLYLKIVDFLKSAKVRIPGDKHSVLQCLQHSGQSSWLLLYSFSVFCSYLAPLYLGSFLAPSTGLAMDLDDRPFKQGDSTTTIWSQLRGTTLPSLDQVALLAECRFDRYKRVSTFRAPREGKTPPFCWQRTSLSNKRLLLLCGN